MASTVAPKYSLAYRADVDGLRALAVIPVVLFHAGVSGFAGGFVGVDVFFVISGYLITAILAKEISVDKFSTLRFYERRIRRLFPALIVMLAACWIAGLILMMPQDLRTFGRSMVATGIGSANILFWAEGGYFDTSAELKPLLHMWSLSVEEQFYLVFPSILLLLMKKVRQWRLVLTAILGASLLACVIYTPIAPTAAFYLPVFRVWELMLGSFVALSIGLLDISDSRLRFTVSTLGLCLVTWTIFTFDQKTSFPGASAIIPCIGAALIIAYSQGTPVALLLGSSPFVWVGKISYSLYLWHWPIIVFTKYYLMRELFGEEKLFVVGLSLVAAYLSLRYVEHPFRERRFARTTASVFVMGMAPMAVFFTAGLGTYIAEGIPERFPAAVQQLAKGARDFNTLRRDCDRPTIDDVTHGTVCTIGMPEATPSFAVLGDSFGDALVPGIAASSELAQRRGLVLTSSGCYPLEGLIDMNKPFDNTCRRFVSASLKLIRDNPAITDVIIVGRWTTAALGTRYGSSTETNWFINDKFSQELSYSENKRVFERSFHRTIAALGDKRLHIVSNIPEQSINPPRILALCAYLSRNCVTSLPLKEYEKRYEFVQSVISKISQNNNIHVIDISSKLCSAAGCSMTSNGSMLYSDDNHLSRTGAMFVQELFLPVFGTRNDRTALVKPNALSIDTEQNQPVKLIRNSN